MRNNNKIFVIGLDVDGVIADFVNPMLELYNKGLKADPFFNGDLYAYGELLESNITSYNMEEFTGDYAWNVIWNQAKEMQLVKNLQR